MVKMINRITGCEMFVDESRTEEYTKQGHLLAASAEIREQMRKLQVATSQQPAAKKPAAKKPATKKPAAKTAKK